MELPFSTVLILAGQEPKVFTFIARMTIIAPVVNPVFAFISDVKCEVLSCARNASPFKDFMIYGWCQNRNTFFDVRLLKLCSYFFMLVSYSKQIYVRISNVKFLRTALLILSGFLNSMLKLHSSKKMQNF